MPNKMSENEKMIIKLLNKAKTDPDALEDAFSLNRQFREEDAPNIEGKPTPDQYHMERSTKYNGFIRRMAAEWIKYYGVENCVDLYKRSLLFDAPHNFDCYCRYIEWNRPQKKRFYEPRRQQLKVVADAMQELAEGKLELLSISLPPGCGKTGLSIFFMTWLGGKDPVLSILGGSHSNSFLRGVYDEMIRILDKDGEYLYNDVFPDSPVVNTNSKDLRIDLAKPKRFETFEFSSIGSGNAGKVRCSRLLYCDDLIDGIETAMSRDRLDKLWQQYYTDLRQRKIGDCVELHVATRWSIADPIGRLQIMYEGNPKAKFLAFPAIDEFDNSNFDYPFSLGFTSAFYRKQREIMDDASWKALYMNEPVEREGRLYDPDELRYYFSLPEREPDAILAICDTKEQGDDYLAMPIFYQYGEDYYLDCWVCDNGKVEILEEKVALALVDRQVRICRIESNRGGTLFASNVQKRVRELGGVTTITTKWTQSNKETRIQVGSGFVRSHILFREQSVRDKEYKIAMDQVTGYTMAGKNRHDDTVDALAMFVDMVVSSEMNTAKVMKRPF